MRDIILLNDNWRFYRDRDLADFEVVRLPHTNAEIPFNYFDEKCYQFVSVYEKAFTLSSDYRGNLIFLTFEGAAHRAEVFINDKKACIHNCGYTAFSVEISKEIKYGEENTVRVVLDSRENLNIPPFGHVIDYLTYGGIYREVYLEIKNTIFIDDIFVKTNSVNGEHKSLEIDLDIDYGKNVRPLSTRGLTASVEFYHDGRLVGKRDDIPVNAGTNTFDFYTDKLPLWSIDNPNMCSITAILKKDGVEVDRKTADFGIRTAVFKQDGFYLNGNKVKIRGLNRHQSYPYVGYAMPQSMQEHDVDILKDELCVNAVRTSHYPQSKYFLDACDRRGLLVFTEAPGWQHIGDARWKQQHLANVADMVIQNRNHPSIILWGVRVNESQDDNKLYKEANSVAHSLDPTRQTSGVRFLQMSNLLEDVYAFNDFSHTGNNTGLTKKIFVTPKPWKPYIVSEYNGHMFPTKVYDDEAHRLSHALRHANVLDAMYDSDNGISGCFGWCMFDYNTHKDFGSGDRICYHGVTDMFRNPKMAAAVYASQSDGELVAEISSSMDIGEHPGGCLSDVYIFTNADFVDLYKNGEFVRRFSPCREKYKNLPHPPMIVDDLIGCLLEEKEGLSVKSSESIKHAVKDFMNGGMSAAITPKNIVRLIRAVVYERLTVSRCMDIFYKYIGNWGSDVTVYRFDFIRHGMVEKSITKAPVTDVVLEVLPSCTSLVEKTTYDVAEINILAKSQDGNLLNYYDEPISLKASGEIEIIGPSVITLKGGMGGTYVKTKGKPGKGRLTVSNERLGKRIIDFTIEKQG